MQLVINGAGVANQKKKESGDNGKNLGYNAMW